MSLGVNNRDATKDLEEKICAFVMSKGEGAKLKAIEIAKGVGLTAAKDVNKTLYALLKAKRLQLLQPTTNNPPLWSLSGPTEPATDEAANPNVTPSETRILSFLRSQRGEKGVTALEISRKLKLERTPVNSQLYHMLEVGAVEVSESSPPEWKCTGDGISKNKKENRTPKTYLCIQMEFCSEGTLRKWIDERNEKEEDICRDKALSIFQNIVDGVQYIHSKDQIHRDLKENQSKYDEKVDIFSLGLILFELLWKLATGMERGKIWPDLRRGRFPENFCNQYTSEHTLIRRMLSELPRRRPTATDIAKRLKVFLEGHNGERDTRTV
ncbi:hypothetical protein JZ751_010928 [Albula glossodonta]|uniref:Uncharacterized protein n=1 Tax=Albula glossodonta TaxID=121402 RepID=A0A8T2NVR1_9TELE|nr:hypothetical protein JZ751_010928 [Albula glossodonta]